MLNSPPWWLEWLLPSLTTASLAAIRILWRRQKAVEHGMQALLRDHIVQAYYHYTERNSISLHGLESVEAMYREYHALGGNGTVSRLMEELRRLKVEDS